MKTNTKQYNFKNLFFQQNLNLHDCNIKKITQHFDEEFPSYMGMDINLHVA